MTFSMMNFRPEYVLLEGKQSGNYSEKQPEVDCNGFWFNGPIGMTVISWVLLFS